MLTKRITQREFIELYLRTLDDPTYRPLVNGQRHFRIGLLLQNNDFELNLNGLNLRNLSFRHADFSGISIEEIDFGGALCHWADFSNAVFNTLYFDENTRFYEAHFTSEQLLRLTLPESTLDSIRRINSEKDPA